MLKPAVAVHHPQAIALYNGARIIFGRAFAFRLVPCLQRALPGSGRCLVRAAEVIPLASQGGGPGGRGMEDEVA